MDYGSPESTFRQVNTNFTMQLRNHSCGLTPLFHGRLRALSVVVFLYTGGYKAR